MNCVNCGNKTAVCDSRAGRSGMISRRRKCDSCGHRFSTVELPLDGVNLYYKYDSALKENDMLRGMLNINSKLWVKK